MCAKIHFFGDRRMLSLEEFYTELGKEGSAGDEEHRWSKPLHLRLAETLVESGFSKEDWDLSLPTGDGWILLCSIEYINDWEDAERENLTAEQIELLTRIKRYLKREIYPRAEDEGVSPT